jgi:hypothetical protein
VFVFAYVAAAVDVKSIKGDRKHESHCSYVVPFIGQERRTNNTFTFTGATAVMDGTNWWSVVASSIN